MPINAVGFAFVPPNSRLLYVSARGRPAVEENERKRNNARSRPATSPRAQVNTCSLVWNGFLSFANTRAAAHTDGKAAAAAAAEEGKRRNIFFSIQ